MKFGCATIAGLWAALLLPCAAFAAASTVDDRIAISANGSTLTGTNGGGGGSLAWLHNFDADSIATVGIEHQALSSAHWTFGTITGAVTRGPEDQRYSFYGEAHEGAGDDGPHAFHYSIVSAGVTGTYFRRLSVQLEDRQIDVESTHGNLPKVGLSYLWGRQILTSVAYAHSVSGNLGTRQTTARVDKYGARINLFAGVAFGQAAPAVLNLQTGIVLPGRQLKEGYIGISKPLPRLRSELTLVGDYLDLSGVKRATVTLNYVFHVGGAGNSR
jgi:hypothetical protein